MPHYLDREPLLLVGCGRMGTEYARVLKALNIPFTAVGRSSQSTRRFAEKTGISACSGGIERYVERTATLPRIAIVAADTLQLAPVTRLLLSRGVRHVLVEKPGGIDTAQLKQLAEQSERMKANVFIAYNRRFYASVRKARQWIREDGGATSFHFEFTELSHLVAASDKDPQVKRQWFLANSTHVVDLAFFLGGEPEHIYGLTAGELDWHPAAAVFAGAGISKSGALFSYHANWASAGRWGIEICTRKRRLVLKPLEQLFVQIKGEIHLNRVDLDDEDDRRFKPGILRQTKAFLQSTSVKSPDGLLSVAEHFRRARLFMEGMCRSKPERGSMP